MAATSIHQPIQAPAPNASLRPRFQTYSIFLLCASLYLIPFMRLLLAGSDEGLLTSGAVRVAHGQVFARDFFEIVGPGTFYWLALFFKLFGVSFVAERICLFISSLGTLSLMYFLSRRICSQSKILPTVILAGTYFGPVWPTISHHVDSNFFALMSIVFVIAWIDSRRGGLLFVAGALAGLTTIFLQPKGLLLFAAIGAWLAILRAKRATSLASIGLLAAGYVSAIGLMVLYFWSHHALWDLIDANYLWPAKHYGPANVVSYAQGIFRDYWHGWASSMGHGWWTAVIASLLVVPFAFVAVIPVLLPSLGIARIKSLQQPEILLYWLCGCALWVAEIHRKDMCHLVFGSPLLIILSIHYIEQYRTTLARVGLQLLSIGAVSLAGLNLCLALAAHPMATRVGTVRVFKNDPTLAYLDANVPPGQEIFIYPYNPILYYLSATTNPTRRSGLGYNYNSASDFQEVVQVLEQRRVKYVVWDTLLEDRALKLYFSIKKPQSDQRILEPYFESHYYVVWEQGGIRVMERNPDGPSG
jgi:hypothetical protein